MHLLQLLNKFYVWIRLDVNIKFPKVDGVLTTTKRNKVYVYLLKQSLFNVNVTVNFISAILGQ